MLKKILGRVLVIILISGLGFAGFKFLLSQKKPALPLSKSKRQITLPLVKIQTVKLITTRITVQAEGIVEAQETGGLVPEVGGKVIYISSHLKPGSKIKKGELLVKLDPANYNLALKQAEAALKQAESNLTLTRAAAKQAILAYQLEHGTNATVPPLIAKKPELKQALAQKENAQAALEQARLNLKRTELFAPYTGIILTKNVGLGEYVSPGKELARFYALDSLEVKVSLSPNELKYLSINSEAEVFSSSLEQKISARLIRIGPKVDEDTRLIAVYLKLFSRQLKPGDFVKTVIQGKEIDKAAFIPASSLHDLDIVWTLNPDQKLEFKKVKVLQRSSDQILVQGLLNGDRIIVTPLGEVKPGLEVRVE
jgi:RND family efflux transporter MFP subunit